MAYTIADARRDLQLEDEAYRAQMTNQITDAQYQAADKGDTVVTGRNFSGQPSPSTYGANMGYTGGYGGVSTGVRTSGQKSAPITFNPPKVTTPKFNEPEMGELPTFAAPKWDESEITKKAQVEAAPGIRKLRTAVQTALGKRYENPNLKRMSMRDALAGYGEGLESVLAGARKAATAEYAQKYAFQYKEAGMNYQTAVQAVRDKYQGQMEARKTEFQAEMNAVNLAYAGELEAERFRVSEARRTDSFGYAYDQYKKSLLGFT